MDWFQYDKDLRHERFKVKIIQSYSFDLRSLTSFGVFIVNFEHISHLFLVFLLLTLNKLMLAGYVCMYVCNIYSRCL